MSQANWSLGTAKSHSHTLHYWDQVMIWPRRDQSPLLPPPAGRVTGVLTAGPDSTAAHPPPRDRGLYPQGCHCPSQVR